MQRRTYTPGSHLVHKRMLGTWYSLTHMQETLLQLTLKTIFFHHKKERKKTLTLMTEIKKGILGTSRTTAILKQIGNIAVI